MQVVGDADQWSAGALESLAAISKNLVARGIDVEGAQKLLIKESCGVVGHSLGEMIIKTRALTQIAQAGRWLLES